MSNNGTNGLDGTRRQRAGGDVLKGAFVLALSPDGRNIYVAASDSGGIAVFTRDTCAGSARASAHAGPAERPPTSGPSTATPS